VQYLGQYDRCLISQSFSLIKGLAIKGSPKSFNAIKSIIHNLKDTSDDIRECIVKNWQNLFSSHDFSRKNKFNISPIYKQRMFSIAFPALIESYRETVDSMMKSPHSSNKNINSSKSINHGMPIELISQLLIPI